MEATLTHLPLAGGNIIKRENKTIEKKNPTNTATFNISKKIKIGVVLMNINP